MLGNLFRTIFMFLATVGTFWSTPCVTVCCLERTMNVQFPESVVIVDGEYFFRSATYYVKLSVDESDINQAKEILIDYCEKNHYGVENALMFHPENNADWWDMDRDEVEFAYYRTARGRLNSTKALLVFMAKGADGKPYFWLVVSKL